MPAAVPSVRLTAPRNTGTTPSGGELEVEPLRGGRPVESVPVLRVRAGEALGASDDVAAEEPLEVQLDGRPVAVTMRTPVPGQDAELALGFLLGESIVTPDDFAGVKECRAGEADGGIADVRLRPGRRAAEGWQRSFYTTSSCGICGKASIDSVLQAAEPVGEGPAVGAETLFALPAALRSSQRVFERTGGLHAAALFDSSGELIVAREDVGRHNAVDKVVGRAAMDGRLPLSRACAARLGPCIVRDRAEGAARGLADRGRGLGALEPGRAPGPRFEHDAGRLPAS